MTDFKPIPGFEGRYSISSQGRVYSHLRGKLLRPSLTLDGYPQVKLSDASRVQRTYRVHRLVAETFIGGIDGVEVHHLDETPRTPPSRISESSPAESTASWTSAGNSTTIPSSMNRR
jgi:hypothetical protein